MIDEVIVYVYGSCHFSERLDTEEGVGNGGYGAVINVNGQTEENSKVFDRLDRAVKWLETNTYETKVLKWNTAAWGRTPADYGRK